MRTLLTTLFAAATLSAAFGQGIEFEHDWATALQRAKAEHKPMLVDFYTDWCGWCKVQDTTTWRDADVARYVNSNMVAVKLDAEREGGEVAVRFRPTGYPTVVMYDPNSEPQRAAYYVGYNADAAKYLAQVKADAEGQGSTIGFNPDQPNPEFPEFVRNRFSKQRTKAPAPDAIEAWLAEHPDAPAEVQWAVLSLSSITPERADEVVAQRAQWQALAGESAFTSFIDNQIFRKAMAAETPDELGSALEFAQMHGGPDTDLNFIKAQWASRKKNWAYLIDLIETPWGAELEVATLNSMLWPIAEDETTDLALAKRAAQIMGNRMTAETDPTFRDTYAWLLFRAGDKKSAKAQAKQAIAESGGKLDSSEELLAKMK